MSGHLDAIKREISRVYNSEVEFNEYVSPIKPVPPTHLNIPQAAVYKVSNDFDISYAEATARIHHLILSNNPQARALLNEALVVDRLTYDEADEAMVKKNHDYIEEGFRIHERTNELIEMEREKSREFTHKKNQEWISIFDMIDKYNDEQSIYDESPSDRPIVRELLNVVNSVHIRTISRHYRGSILKIFFEDLRSGDAN